jgi:hypothetical protein
MAPTAAILLRAWESATAAVPLDRAPSLLHSLGAVAPGVRTDDMTVGQCDAWLFKLRRVIFGEMLEVLATCPECQNDVELTVALGELQPPLREGAVAPLTVQVDGYTLRCRIPTNEDLRILGRRRVAATLRDLLDRCVIEANTAGGAPVSPGQLPEAAVEATVGALAESDPGACTELRVCCPCGGEWVDELDIRDVVWSELTEWVGRTLTQVHQLARAYGWSEAEILEMSGWRRRWYLEAAGW